MKKKFFFAAVALVMSAATAVGYKAYDKGNMSEFMMANIEALTQDEIINTIVVECETPSTELCAYQCVCGILWGNSRYGTVLKAYGKCQACNTPVNN